MGLLCPPSRGCSSSASSSSSSCRSGLLGAHEGHWDGVRGFAWSDWKAQNSSKDEGTGPGGTGLGTSLRGRIRAVVPTHFLQSPQAVPVPGGVWPWDERVGVFCSLRGQWEQGGGWRGSLGGLGCPGCAGEGGCACQGWAPAVSTGCPGVLWAVSTSPRPLAFPCCSPGGELALGWILLLLGTI